VFAVPAEHRVAVLEGLEQAERGLVMTDEGDGDALEEVRAMKPSERLPRSITSLICALSAT
jgi:hypothetical protein